MKFLHRRHQRTKPLSTFQKTVMALYAAYIVFGFYAIQCPEGTWLRNLFDVVYFPILLGFLTFEISQIPKYKEVSVFLLLHDANPKTERWHWVADRPAPGTPQGTTFLELQNTGHSFLEKFLVEVTYVDQTRCCYRIPMGLATEKSLFLQVDRPMDQIAGVRIACFLSPETEVFSFGGTLHKKGQTAIFSMPSHDAKPRMKNTPEQLCRPEPD